jgi:hypothetical protein
MPTIDEIIGNAKTQVNAVLDSGVDLIAAKQEIKFTKYVKLVLPLDGFVFWVRSDLIGAAALLNATQSGPNPVSSDATFYARGALHQSVDRRQEEDQTASISTIIFTAEEEVQPLSEISPVIMFIGEFNGIRFAFARRGAYFQQANLNHYIGESIHPAMLSQIVDSITGLSQLQVVSNSLPIWLTLNAKFPVYPAFLLPDNLQPPYASVYVQPNSTRALQPTPYIDLNSSSWQLVAEKVRVTMYGVRNDYAIDYLNYVESFSLDTESIGIMNAPVVIDEQRTQRELTAIAMKKVIDFEVNYYQTRLNSIARQFIKSVLPTYNLT